MATKSILKMMYLDEEEFEQEIIIDKLLKETIYNKKDQKANVPTRG